ncbi:MAG: MBL fold metallo-hydrolase [Saprospiraceae bacterium]
MIIKTFTFNDFLENTYILYDDSKECIIVDPGCNSTDEKKELTDFVSEHKLRPKKLINTHCHIDHILGNSFTAQKYNLTLAAHRGEVPVLESGKQVSIMYGIPYTPSPEIKEFLQEGQEVVFGNTNLKILFTPGHSPASICLYHEESQNLIAGDVLFQGSIGRTDLPGGNHETLIRSIKNKLFILPNEVQVFPGHGESTTIGFEKKYNPFFNE